MAGIKLHGTPLSTATMRGLAALYEKGLDFQFVLVDMRVGAHKSPEFLSLNPFGQVPALEDGDLKLFESRAISHYIAETYHDKGNQLFRPGCSKTRAITKQWMEVESQQFDPLASKLTFEHFYKPYFNMTPDPPAVEELETKLAKVLDVYEGRLSESKYLSCDCFTLADLHHLPTLHFLSTTTSKKVFDARPKVSAWKTDILARPAWSKVTDLLKK